MSKTLLTGVNDLLERTGIIDSNGTLSSFTNQGLQLFIDLAIQVWNETVDDICNMMGTPHSGETASSTITLVTGTREYALPSDLVQMRWPLMDQTNGNYITEYPGGYEQMRIDQLIPGNWTGLPYAAAINPTTGYLRMDRAPTSSENGFAYDLLYDKDLVMTTTTDTFPFSDATYRAVLPVVTEAWERRKRNDFDLEEHRKQLSRALSYSNKALRRSHW
ncbi:MAG TPA: hypothetical protein VIY48_07065 [Candidatus Paceibacterota bacterium]